ncbi:hypothetical protein BR63_08985 [Thermanaerosceptrum fracticalcis]|uniref:ECF transporter S component n=1 Tax=Thermanaerosceptrum fracticalcis TaxID=1712410 RepID=A0A7G6E2Y0_THEFR|nr:hypothetical protein [Thermanaerosceptrum fracticalcis]QNB46434.1 hypothetical protein BR63_08985 [Thermanaerosceptrum fracticalcis]
MNNKEWKNPRNLTIGALLASVAVGFQASPLYLPFIGISFSSLSTLPIALAGYIHGITGFLAYLVAGFIMLTLSVPQALIFFLSSGLLGLSLGILMKRQAPFPAVVGIAALLLSVGMFILGFLLGIPVLPWLTGVKRALLIPVTLCLTLLYSAIWAPVLAAVIVRVKTYL